MKHWLTVGVVGALGLVVAAGVYQTVSTKPAGASAVESADGLASFASEAELRRFLKAARPKPVSAPGSGPTGALPTAEDSKMDTASADTVTASADAAAADGESITNTQEAGVDEGGIVKSRGDLLVILRRGRLFTVSTAGGTLRTVDRINAFPPGFDATGAWYDEMLVVGDRVVVIGYSYAVNGSQVNRFRLSPDGRLSFEDSHVLRASDYYSSENYASRLIGSTLVMYNAIAIPERGDPLAALPTLRRWTGPEVKLDGAPPPGEPIVETRDVYLPPDMKKPGVGRIDTLHSVSRCDLAAPRMTCKATAVLGASSRVFYVSGSAVYLWTASAWRDEREGRAAMLYRMPLDGAPPRAVGVRGMPTDQFSFREDAADGFLNVLVQAHGGGDGMWRSAQAGGAVALLRLPLAGFTTGRIEAAPGAYRDLPAPAERAALTNRFVGAHVLYGYGAGWSERRTGPSTLVAAPVAGGEVATLNLPHPVDRIEVLGADAPVVGSDREQLTFSTIELPAGGRPVVGDSYGLSGAAEGETRSHGFFYKADPGSEGRSGLVGLPVARRATAGYEQLTRTSAAMLFLRRSERRFSPLGDLLARESDSDNDGCIASCADWYGNARPIFLGGRIYALLGYELVEGRVEEGRIMEVGRISFAPPRDPSRG